MCKRAVRRGHGRGRAGDRLSAAVLGWCLLTGGTPSFLGAQAVDESFPLEPQTRQHLVTLQESWIEWLSRMQQGDLEEASFLVDGLLFQAGEMGMRSLPDLATAAAVQAVAFAEESQATKAQAALAAAERLQPREPAVAFAAMNVAWNQKQPFSALSWWARGVSRTVSSPLVRRVAIANVIHWVLVVLSLSAFSFVGLQMATRGHGPFRDLAGFIGHSLPPVAAYLLATALMLWPVLLPSGLLWLVLYWSVLLWGYGTRGERTIMIVLWVFVGVLPLLVSEHVRRLDFGISSPVQALENAATGRLTGSLFADLGVLFESLPESPAVRHLEADLHLQLHQWELARAGYQDVLAHESGNTAALTDLGTVYFHQGELDSAVSYLQQATAAADAPVEAFFGLSRALSEQYQFGESETMLRRASTMDSRAVGKWITAVAANQVVSVSAGLARRKEISLELRSVWRGDEEASLTAMWRRMLSLPLALVLIGPAVGVFFLARRNRRLNPKVAEPWFDGLAEWLRMAVLPGLPELERKKPFRAWLALVVVLAFFTLPFFTGFGFSMPLGYTRGVPVFWLVSGTGIVIYLVIRFLFSRSGRKAKA